MISVVAVRVLLPICKGANILGVGFMTLGVQKNALKLTNLRSSSGPMSKALNQRVLCERNTLYEANGGD